MLAKWWMALAMRGRAARERVGTNWCSYSRQMTLCVRRAPMGIGVVVRRQIRHAHIRGEARNLSERVGFVGLAFHLAHLAFDCHNVASARTQVDGLFWMQRLAIRDVWRHEGVCGPSETFSIVRE